MKLFWPTIPTDFPVSYLLEKTDDSSHQLYVKCKWAGLPDTKYLPGVLDNEWEMGCLDPSCTCFTVLNIKTLLKLLKEGNFIGTYRNGIAVTGGK